MIAFMVNVAWGNQYLFEFLGILRKYEVKSTFFLDGLWVELYPELARKIRDGGHEIGNHAYSHPDMRGMTEDHILWELCSTNAVIRKELGVIPRLFTPPAGEYDERVVKLAFAEGMKAVLWSIDTTDWIHPTPKEIINKVNLKLQNGSIILMHPTDSILNTLPGIIELIKNRGYEIRTITELLSRKGA